MAARLKAKRPNNWVPLNEYLAAIRRAETAEQERDAWLRAGPGQIQEKPAIALGQEAMLCE